MWICFQNLTGSFWGQHTFEKKKNVDKSQGQQFLWLTDTFLTHSDDVSFHWQQVKEGKELDSEDGVDLRGRQHQHSQRQQHLGIPLQPSAALPLTLHSGLEPNLSHLEKTTSLCSEKNTPSMATRVKMSVYLGFCDLSYPAQRVCRRSSMNRDDYRRPLKPGQLQRLLTSIHRIHTPHAPSIFHSHLIYYVFIFWSDNYSHCLMCMKASDWRLLFLMISGSCTWWDQAKQELGPSEWLNFSALCFFYVATYCSAWRELQAFYCSRHRTSRQNETACDQVWRDHQLKCIWAASSNWKEGNLLTHL